MSRFFDALREASRSEPVPAASPERAQSPPEAGLDAFPEPPASRRASGTADVLGLFDAFGAPSKNSFEPRPIEVKLAPDAPLLPNSVDPTILEQYRRLRTKIQQQHATKPVRTLLVASPGPGEGKTVTALNVALSFAMLPSCKVLVVDGDLRKGTVRKWLRPAGNPPGLGNVIEGSARPADVIFHCATLPIHFVFSGTSQKSSAELLHAPALGNFMRRVAEEFDLVIVDSPPVNLLADAQLLAAHCDGALLVARAFSTASKAFRKAMQDLGSSVPIVGTVLNAGMRPNLYKRYYNY